MGKAENRVESYLVEQVKARGGHQRKVQYIGRNGCPDRLVWFVFPRVAWVEVKSDTGDLEASQAREIPRLLAAGWPVYTVSSRAEVDEVLREIKMGHKVKTVSDLTAAQRTAATEFGMSEDRYLASLLALEDMNGGPLESKPRTVHLTREEVLEAAAMGVSLIEYARAKRDRVWNADK